MKLFLILLSIALALAAPDHSEEHHGKDGDYVVKKHADLIKFRDHCAKEVNADEATIAKYTDWKYPDDETTRCYMKCVFEQFGFFDGTKGFDVKKVHEQLTGKQDTTDHTTDHTDDTHRKIEECVDKNTQGSDACTWAYRGGMCFINNHPELVQRSAIGH